MHATGTKLSEKLLGNSLPVALSKTACGSAVNNKTIIIITAISIRTTRNANCWRYDIGSVIESSPLLRNAPIAIQTKSIHIKKGVNKLSVNEPNSHLIPSLLNIERICVSGMAAATPHETINNRTSKIIKPIANLLVIFDTLFVICTQVVEIKYSKL